MGGFIGPPEFDKGTEKMEVKVGEIVLLSCRVAGASEYEFRWLIDEQPVDKTNLSRTVRVSNCMSILCS